MVFIFVFLYKKIKTEGSYLNKVVPVDLPMTDLRFEPEFENPNQKFFLFSVFPILYFFFSENWFLHLPADFSHTVSLFF